MRSVKAIGGVWGGSWIFLKIFYLKIWVIFSTTLLRNQKIRIFREMAVVWIFRDLPIFCIVKYWKLAKFGGSKEISVWPYFNAEMTSEALNWSKLSKYGYILRKNCKIGEKEKWCWEAQLWLEINYGWFLTKSGSK